MYYLAGWSKEKCQESLRSSTILAPRTGVPSQTGGRVYCGSRSFVNRSECGVAGAEGGGKMERKP